MIAALLLLGYAVLAGGPGARVLLRATWPVRSPRAGLMAWLALTTSVVLAVLLAGVALALPFLPLHVEVAAVLGADHETVADHYGSPHGAGPAIAGMVAVLLACAHLGRTAFRGARTRHRTRRDQRALLDLVGEAHPDGFTLVEHERPLVYCLPGRTRRIVVSRSALRILTADQRRVVLAHERRHLRGRHDLALTYLDALARAFGWVPLFAAAHRRAAVLVEMAADDAATTPAERRTLAQALVALASGDRPAAALGAADTAAAERVRRLVDPAPRARHGHTVLVAAVAVTVLSVPVVLALTPALEASSHGARVHRV